MLLGNYNIEKTNDKYIIRRKDISFTIIISDYEIASVVGTSSLNQLQYQTEKWKHLKVHKDILLPENYMFIKFMLYAGRWIQHQALTEEEFVKKKVHWYSNKELEILAVMLALVIIKFRIFEESVIESIPFI